MMLTPEAQQPVASTEESEALIQQKGDDPQESVVRDATKSLLPFARMQKIIKADKAST